MPNEISWPVLARRMNRRLQNLGHEPVVDESALSAYEGALEKAQRSFGDDYQSRILFGETQAFQSLSSETQAELAKLFERTTVTKRLRRIADLDVASLALTVKKERPAYIALTFLNYLFPELSPAHNPERRLHEEAIGYLMSLQWALGCWIRYVSIGPRSEDLLEMPPSFSR
jgi:hypothetical protein